jgi:hypothetical protein
MQRENERGVPSHRWSVNPLAGGPRSAAKRVTKIEGSGSATEMGSASDWRSATEMGSASDWRSATEMGSASGQRQRWVLRATEMGSSRGFKPKRNMLSRGGGGGGGLQRTRGGGEEREVLKGTETTPFQSLFNF